MPISLNHNLADAGLLTQTHLAAATMAIILGLVQFLGLKGSKAHKAVGWCWVLLMAYVALSSVFMRHLNHGHISVVHGFTALTAVLLPFGVYAARRGDIINHRNLMLTLYVGGLIIAASFTLAPGRLLNKIFFGH